MSPLDAEEGVTLLTNVVVESMESVTVIVPDAEFAVERVRPVMEF